MLIRILSLFTFLLLSCVAFAENTRSSFKAQFEKLPPDLIAAMKEEIYPLYDAYASESVAQFSPNISILNQPGKQRLFIASYGTAPHCELTHDIWFKQSSASPYSFIHGFTTCGDVTIKETNPLTFKVAEINPVLDHTTYKWTGKTLEHTDHLVSVQTIEILPNDLSGLKLYDILAKPQIQDQLLEFMETEDLIALGYQTGTEYFSEIIGDHTIVYGCVRPRKCSFSSAALAISTKDDTIFAVLKTGNHWRVWGDISAKTPLPQKLQDYISTGRW